MIIQEGMKDMFAPDSQARTQNEAEGPETTTFLTQKGHRLGYSKSWTSHGHILRCIDLCLAYTESRPFHGYAPNSERDNFTKRRRYLSAEA